jgi:uncharacterized LabA/DUF88 family protein
MPKLEKDSTQSQIKSQPSDSRKMTLSENYCKSTLVRSVDRTLSLKKCIRSVNFEKFGIIEAQKMKQSDGLRYVDMRVNPTDCCAPVGLVKDGNISERANISSIENSLADTADFFIDGQNLFHSIKNLYEYKHLNVDVVELCKAISKKMGRNLGKIRFYTGISSPSCSPHWHEYWTNRVESLRKDGVECFCTDLRYIDGRGTEKGVDVMIALDIVERSMSGPGLIVIMSQDNDLAVAVKRATEKARKLNFEIELASAFPVRDREQRKGITGTTEVRIDRLFYDKYLEKEDSRCQHMRDHHEGLSSKKYYNFSNRDNYSTIH